MSWDHPPADETKTVIVNMLQNMQKACNFVYLLTFLVSDTVFLFLLFFLCENEL